MSTVFINNDAMIQWGRETLRRFGSWDAVRKASTRNEKGWWIVPPDCETPVAAPDGKAEMPVAG